MRSVCLALETSCRAGGVALAVDGALTAVRRFDASSRHATTLLVHLRELLTASGLAPADVTEVYVSVGPGSFTGVRVGVTVARTLAQAVGGGNAIQTVAVPTTHVVAENARTLPWQHLAVILDAKDDVTYVQLFQRETQDKRQATSDKRQEKERLVFPKPIGQPRILTPQQMLAECPRPITLIGEGIAFHPALAEPVDGITLADTALHLPTAESVYHVGRRLALTHATTDYHILLPIYARKSEAERLWEKKQRQATSDK